MSNVIALPAAKEKPISDFENAVISGFSAAEDALLECKAEGKPVAEVSYETASCLYDDMFASTPDIARAELASFIRRMLEFAGAT